MIMPNVFRGVPIRIRETDHNIATSFRVAIASPCYRYQKFLLAETALCLKNSDFCSYIDIKKYFSHKSIPTNDMRAVSAEN